MRQGLKQFLTQLLFTAFAVCAASGGAIAQGASIPRDEYTEKIKPIFESRCVSCHSCFNAPCQLNLQTYSGATRGATSDNVYDAERLHSVPPTRLDIDAKTTEEWRAKGFFDVLGAHYPDASLLLRLTKLRHTHASLQPKKKAAESQICAPGTSDPRLLEKDNRPAVGMPYGLPPLSPQQITDLQAWVEKGAPGPANAGKSDRETIPPTLKDQVRTWEAFFNAGGARQKLVSRYLYEHLFLAHLYFAAPETSVRNSTPFFFRLVRSRTSCDEGLDEIATRRPTDSPGSGRIFYCLRPDIGTIVEKKHIPYELSPAKLSRLKSLFLGGTWKANAPRGYEPERANNPFETFAEIPVKARYQFLLDDAHYHIATFIKGPVCNGSAAVNSIQEQFFVLFLKPDADSMVMLPEHAKAAEKKLVLPGEWGSDVGLLQDLPFFTRIIEYREDYRRLRARSVRKLRPNGYTLDDIWDGDGNNPNALLTVFRHDDNAAVVKGAAGDLPKTLFVLDYPLFERLVYNLVVNFDVYGNVGHQVLTRVYMDLIRMEAEELFLSFLPPPDRKKLRSAWYQGSVLTDIKLNIVFPLTNQDQPTGISYRTTNHKREFTERALFERLPKAVRGPADPINWRHLVDPTEKTRARLTSPVAAAFRAIASVPAAKATPFARYFPELSFVLVKESGGASQVYSIAHNREHDNVSWIMGEKLRLAPREDTLTIREGILGAYANMLFVIEEKNAADFAQMVARIRSASDFERLVDRYGVRRTSDRFWQVFDEINAIALENEPIQRGRLDLTRYDLVKR